MSLKVVEPSGNYSNFTFEVQIPNTDPIKERIILVRDRLGRIVHSKPPEVPIIQNGV